MRNLRRERAKLGGFLAVFVLVTVSIIIAGARERGDSRRSTPPEMVDTAAAAEPEQQPADIQSEKQTTATRQADAAPAVERKSDQQEQEVKPPAKVVKPTRPAVTTSVGRVRSSGAGSLPPLYGPGVGTTATEPTSLGPPPGVLWLAGIIDGETKVALLRRGENRYLVREGDSVDGTYRVASISASGVTLKRGSRTVQLRPGQY